LRCNFALLTLKKSSAGTKKTSLLTKMLIHPRPRGGARLAVRRFPARVVERPLAALIGAFKRTVIRLWPLASLLIFGNEVNQIQRKNQ
jgi:hypothetical protein